MFGQTMSMSSLYGQTISATLTLHNFPIPNIVLCITFLQYFPSRHYTTPRPIASLNWQEGNVITLNTLNKAMLS